MLVCPKCNNENRIGSVFCRKCGEKLDVSDLRPPKRSELRGGGRRWPKFVRAIIFLAILGAIVYGAFEMFTPLDLEPEELPDQRKSEIWRTYQRLTEDDFSESLRLSLNSAEATFLFNRILALEEKEDVSGAMVPEKIMFNFLPGNRVKAVLRYRVFDRLESDTVLTGTLRVDESSDKVEFEPETYHIGRVPMKWYLEKVVLDRFRQQFSDRSELEKAREQIKEINIRGGEVLIITKEPETENRTEDRQRRLQERDAFDLGETPDLR